MNNHKCRVFKYAYEDAHFWLTMCYNRQCSMRSGYLTSTTWDEAVLEALHHRIRNS